MLLQNVELVDIQSLAIIFKHFSFQYHKNVSRYTEQNYCRPKLFKTEDWAPYRSWGHCSGGRTAGEI